MRRIPSHFTCSCLPHLSSLTLDSSQITTPACMCERENQIYLDSFPVLRRGLGLCLYLMSAILGDPITSGNTKITGINMQEIEQNIDPKTWRQHPMRNSCVKCVRWKICRVQDKIKMYGSICPRTIMYTSRTLVGHPPPNDSLKHRCSVEIYVRYRKKTVQG